MRAVKDLWIIGDHFVREAYPFLQQLGDDFKNGQHNYLFHTYDIYCHYPDFTQTNEMAMVRNAAIEAMNKHDRMPSAIIIICGGDFVNEDPLYLPSEIEKKIRWILRDITSAISIKKSLIPPKCFTFGEPRIFWIRGFQTAKGNDVAPDVLLKFNNMLKRICSSKAIYAPDLALYLDAGERCYDGKNRKNPQGFKTMWLALSDQMKKIDEDDEQYAINLKVEDRLKELKRENEKSFERQAHTFLSIKHAAGQRSDTVRNIDQEGNAMQYRHRTNEYHRQGKNAFNGNSRSRCERSPHTTERRDCDRSRRRDTSWHRRHDRSGR